MREALGESSLRSSSHLALNSGPKLVKPVIFPPGRARLATKPDPIGSETNVMTIGTAPAAFLAAQVGLVPAVRMTSTLSRMSSSTSAI